MNRVRRLGYGELVYDHELELGNHLLVFLARFSTAGHDLFANLNAVQAAVAKWVDLNPFLRARIAKFEDRKHFFLPSEPSKRFSNLRFFDLKKSNGDSTDAEVRQCVDLFYEREFNIQPVDPRTAEHLWRISFVRTRGAPSYEFSLVFHIHHAITDGKNSYAIVEQLLHLLEQRFAKEAEFRAATSYGQVVTSLQPSLEQLLFGGDEQVMRGYEPNLEYQLSSRNKIPRCFAASEQQLEASASLSKVLADYWFENVLDPSQKIQVRDLIKRRNNPNETDTKFRSFEIDRATLVALTQRARAEQAKLTSFFIVVFSLAMHDAFKTFDTENESEGIDACEITYHLMATLRTHLNVPDEQMGFCSSFMQGIQRIKPDLILHQSASVSEWQRAIWKASSAESAILHARLKAGEQIESVKADLLLYEDLQKAGQVFENGGTHFAISNLGVVDKSSRRLSGAFKLLSFSHQVSMQEMRWSSVVFNGLQTLDDKLHWGVTYNARLFADRVIDLITTNLIDYIRKSILASS